MRRSAWTRVVLPLAGAAGVAATVLLGAGTPAGAGPAGAPGNNGTVKIHDGAGEPAAEVRNEPHVCTFHVHAFFLDAGQVVTFEVLSWPPTGDRSVVLTGSIAADADGEGRTAVYSLPDGHYKLDVDTGEGRPIKDKHKVFWVECATTPPTTQPTTPPTSPTSPGSPSGTTSPPASPTSPPGTTSPGTTSPGTTPPGTTSPGTTAPGTTAPGTTPPAAPPTSQAAGGVPPSTGSGLPMTGSPTALVVALGSVLLLAGAGLLLSPWGRRRLFG
jgi:hypothetical protein